VVLSSSCFISWVCLSMKSKGMVLGSRGLRSQGGKRTRGENRVVRTGRTGRARREDVHTDYGLGIVGPGCG
jgi:hypothetical protein